MSSLQLPNFNIAVSSNNEFKFHIEGSLGNFTIESLQKPTIVSSLGFNTLRFGTKRLFRLLPGQLLNADVSANSGYYKFLVLQGIGYRVATAVSGRILYLSLNYTHYIAFVIPKSVHIRFRGKRILIFGLYSYLVNSVAAIIKQFRFPNIYKGFGIKYQGEIVTLKPGKKTK